MYNCDSVKLWRLLTDYILFSSVWKILLFPTAFGTACMDLFHIPIYTSNSGISGFFWVSLGLWSRWLVNDQKWVIYFFWSILPSPTLEVTWCFYVQWAKWVFHLWKSMWVASKMQHLGLRTTNLDAAQDLNHLLTQDAAAKLALWDENATVLGTDKQITRYHKLSSNEMFWCMKLLFVFSALGNYM